MKNKFILWFSIGIICVIIAVLINQYYHSNKKFNWSESYEPNSDNPFTTSIIAELMEDYFPEYSFKIVKNDLPTLLKDSLNKEHSTYFFIGNSLSLSDSTMKLLKAFVERGNDAFIASNVLPEKLLLHQYNPLKINEYTTTGIEIEPANDSLKWIKNDSTIVDTKTFTSDNNEKIISAEENLIDNDNSIVTFPLETYNSISVKLNFTQAQFKHSNYYLFNYQEKDREIAYTWQYFTTQQLTNKAYFTMQPLGTLNDVGYNYIEVNLGKGKIYIFTTPLLLTNYYLIHKNNLEYISKVLSQIKQGDLIWDEYSKINHPLDEHKKEAEMSGPLQYIISQQSLRAGWYCFLAALLLFLLFKSKRVQKVIPIIEPNLNKSLEFVQTIGRMYVLRNNQQQLVAQKMKFLNITLKEKYQLNTLLKDSHFFEKLSLKSQIPKEQIIYLFTRGKQLEEQQEVTNQELIELHNLIYQFYKNSK